MRDTLGPNMKIDRAATNKTQLQRYGEEAETETRL